MEFTSPSHLQILFSFPFYIFFPRETFTHFFSYLLESCWKLRWIIKFPQQLQGTWAKQLDTCVWKTCNIHFTQMELTYFLQHFKTEPGTTTHPIYSLTCNIIFTTGSNRNASFKCQWIIYYGKLISYINASLFRVGEEETVNTSWINLVLLSFEAFSHLT